MPDPVQVDEQALFTDPYAVLSDIAGGLVSEPDDGGKKDEGSGESASVGVAGGEAFYDPFDPASWNTELGLAKKAESGGEHEKSGEPVTKPETDIAAILAREGNALAQGPSEDKDKIEPDTAQQGEGEQKMAGEEDLASPQLAKPALALDSHEFSSLATHRCHSCQAFRRRA